MKKRFIGLIIALSMLSVAKSQISYETKRLPGLKTKVEFDSIYGKPNIRIVYDNIPMYAHEAKDNLAIVYTWDSKGDSGLGEIIVITYTLRVLRGRRK